MQMEALRQNCEGHETTFYYNGLEVKKRVMDPCRRHADLFMARHKQRQVTGGNRIGYAIFRVNIKIYQNSRLCYRTHAEADDNHRHIEQAY